MKNRLVRPAFVLALGIIFLAVTNPSEEKFLTRVSQDYGAVHGGMQFSPAELQSMGESRRQSYFVFSTYEYEFGAIGVRYVGFLFSIFHVESYRNGDTPEPDDSDGVLATDQWKLT